MMISYSVTAIMVDMLQSHADRPLTEAEIENRGIAADQVTRDTARRQGFRSWLGQWHWRMPQRHAAFAAQGSAYDRPVS